jgi:hypothetical protein
MPGSTATTTYSPNQLASILCRRIQTKSHYKMTCRCCKQDIKRGDSITQITGNKGSLRVRGSDTPYSYKPSRNDWVHLECRPSYWYTYGWSPMFVAGFTRYSDSIARRRDLAAHDPDWGENWWDIPDPDWKLEEERITASLTKLQRKWKGWKQRQLLQNSSVSGGTLQDWQVSLLKSLERG